MLYTNSGERKMCDVPPEQANTLISQSMEQNESEIFLLRLLDSLSIQNSVHHAAD